MTDDVEAETFDPQNPEHVERARNDAIRLVVDNPFLMMRDGKYIDPKPWVEWLEQFK